MSGAKNSMSKVELTSCISYDESHILIDLTLQETNRNMNLTRCFSAVNRKNEQTLATRQNERLPERQAPWLRVVNLALIHERL